jgi:hypothetical protein
MFLFTQLDAPELLNGLIFEKKFCASANADA